MPQFDSIPAMISESFDRDISRDKNWYQRYKQTHEKVMADPRSDEALEILWYVRDNAVSSLMQGNTAKEEFERAKPQLRSLTMKIIESPSTEMYEDAVQEMRDLKSEGTLRQFYGALLNRVFAAIAPDKVTSSVKEPAFNLAANFINDHFNLGLNLRGNWYENNLVLKKALREKLPDDFDDFKINIAVWNVYELLEEENKVDDNLIESELNEQNVKPLSLSVAQYKEVLQADGVINKNSLNLLSAMGNSSISKITASHLAKDLGLTHLGPVNARIGKLSKRIAKYFDIDKQDIKNRFTGWWQLVAEGERLPEGFTWRLKDNLKTALIELGMIEHMDTPSIKEQTQDYLTQTSLNQIFYGPPGTGKTYHTIEAAVKAAEPDYIYTSREELKAKYDALVNLKRIQFVTFHQSYGYEEFVEGIKAKSEDGQISYEVEPGIFTQICRQASVGIEQENDPFEQGLEKFKQELEEHGELRLKTIKGKEFDVQYHGNSTFKVFPLATVKGNLVKGYAVSIDNIRKLFRRDDKVNIYNPSYTKAILKYIRQTHLIGYFDESKSQNDKNFVLVIDEINRGNISKIFGELITLIEGSKRAGQPEAIELSLPYSGEPLSVPSNLHLIGTMNTADRSLAMMDTALRRRFDFIEMMPDYSVLTGVIVRGIRLDSLLRQMNARIEALYDREHMLGHAFLIPVKEALIQSGEAQAFSVLKTTFINKFIPLLEEYFFDDWNKIRLVLGDNQKPEALQFVKRVSHSFDDLFGAEHGLDSFVDASESFELAIADNNVWDDPAAYIGIFSAVNEQ